MVANPASVTEIAVNRGSCRIRCWVVVVPARLAKNLFSCTRSRLALVWLTPSASSSRPISSSIRALRSASGTSNGLTSYAETHSALACTGSSASSTRFGVSGRDTFAVATARSAKAAAASAVRLMPAAKPQTPSCTTRTDRPRPDVVAAGLQLTITEAARRLTGPLDPDVRVAAAQVTGAGQCRVGQCLQRQRREGLVDPAHPADPNAEAPTSSSRRCSSSSRAARIGRSSAAVCRSERSSSM